MEIILKEDQIKALLEEIFLKLLKERKEIFYEIFEDLIEEIALAKAIQEGRRNEFVEKQEVMEILKDENSI